MFARRRSSSYQRLNKIKTTRFNIALLTCFLFVAIENVTSASLEGFQQQQNDKQLDFSEMMLPEAESVMFDNDMEVMPVAVDDNSDMYLLTPATSQHKENDLQSLSEQDESMHPSNAEGMSDMLMLESEDTPTMQILEIPDEIIENKIEETIEAQVNKEDKDDSSNQVTQISAEETEQSGNITTDFPEAVVDMMAEAVQEIEKEIETELIGNEEVETEKKYEHIQIENQKEGEISNNDLPLEHKDAEKENTETNEQEKISLMEIKPEEIAENADTEQEDMIGVVMEESNQTPVSDIEETEKIKTNSIAEESESIPIFELVEAEVADKQDKEEEHSQMAADSQVLQDDHVIEENEDIQAVKQPEIVDENQTKEHGNLVQTVENTQSDVQPQTSVELQDTELSQSMEAESEKSEVQQAVTEILNDGNDQTNEKYQVVEELNVLKETQALEEPQIAEELQKPVKTQTEQDMIIEGIENQTMEYGNIVSMFPEQTVDDTQANGDENQTSNKTAVLTEETDATTAKTQTFNDPQFLSEEIERTTDITAIVAQPIEGVQDDSQSVAFQAQEEIQTIDEMQTTESVSAVLAETEQMQDIEESSEIATESQVMQDDQIIAETQMVENPEDNSTKDTLVASTTDVANEFQSVEIESVTETQISNASEPSQTEEAVLTAENQESVVTEEKPDEILADETYVEETHKDEQIQPISLVDEGTLQSIDVIEEIKKDDEPVVEAQKPSEEKDDNILEDDTNETETSSILTTIIQVPIQEEQHHEPQQPAIDTVTTISATTLTPLNVMDSVLNYVNASLMDEMNNVDDDENKQEIKDDETVFSSKLRRYDGAQVWRIVVQNDREKKLADELQTKYDGQLWKEVKQEVDYLLKPQVLVDAERHVRSANLSRIVLIDNLQKVIEVENPPAEEIAQLQNRKGHRLTWQAYHRLEDIHGYLEYLAKTYPDICSVETIGYSIEKRPLKILKISNGNANNPGIWIDGGMHAREWISPAVVTFVTNQIVEGWDELPAYMRNVNWYIHAVANPDGYEYSHTTDRLWRKNMRSHGRVCPGVDLNRNFGYKWGGKGTSANPCAQTYRGSKAFSEPETFYISKFISNFPRETFKAYLSFHSYGQYILYPWGYDYHITKDMADLDLVARQAGTIITKSTGVKYTVGSSATTLYPAAGGSDDWAKGIAGIKYSYTIEMGDTGRYGFILPAAQIESNGQNGFTFVETIAKAITMGKNSRRRKLKAKSH